MSPQPNNELAHRRKAVKKHAAKQTPAKHAGKHAKKAAKHAAKHSARHTPPPRETTGSPADEHGTQLQVGKKDGKHLRRVYEHLARVRVLLRVTSGDTKLRAAAERLAVLATVDLQAGRTGAKMAAELTRAAEHIAFAGLGAAEEGNAPWSAALAEALEAEYTKLREDGELRGAARKSRGERASALRTLHELMAATAEDALGRANYSCALEHDK